MKYTAWGNDEGSEFTFVEGDKLRAGDTPGLKLLAEFEAASWEDAMQQYHRWQGWEPYRPFEDNVGGA